ncbi:hypothetical protein B296_00053581 [Ensete ventricosum]|uniref:Uncharacterized protein n=1 Tax=Ensete ventricosum TaxID=4639 RepID=A0A426XK81_ENSVE|nr:hypothetical protein B296_00053581 [Ensete ventricosum]
MVCTIPASAWTWLVRPRKASAVTMGGAGFDAGEGNPGSVIILQKRLGVGPCALGRPPRSLFGTKWELVRMSGDSELGLGGRLLEWSFYNGCCRLLIPDDLTAFMTYHATAPSAMSSCLTMLAVLTVRRALADGGCRPYLCQVDCTTAGVLRTAGRPPTSGWPRRRASCPRV